LIDDDSEEENDCDTGYCFAEFHNCIDTCTKKNCGSSKDDCYDNVEGEEKIEYEDVI